MGANTYRGWDVVLTFLHSYLNSNTANPKSDGINTLWVITTLLLLLLVLSASVSAEVRRPFSTRFEANEPGDILLIGNTSLRADPNDPDAANSQNGIGSRINNNNFNMVNVDVDTHGSTFNSSSADFTIPSGGEVLWASQNHHQFT